MKVEKNDGAKEKTEDLGWWPMRSALFCTITRWLNALATLISFSVAEIFLFIIMSSLFPHSTCRSITCWGITRPGSGPYGVGRDVGREQYDPAGLGNIDGRIVNHQGLLIGAFEGCPRYNRDPGLAVFRV